jgi:uncharacterized protein YdiU (UPF0061 family)
VTHLVASLEAYGPTFLRSYREMMSRKLGLTPLDLTLDFVRNGWVNKPETPEIIRLNS